MARITYRLWNHSRVIQTWDNIDAASEDIRDYIAANPHELAQLHFASYKSTYKTGSTPLYAHVAENILEYLDTLEY
jgi:hypothetical protein